ncbi:Ig-like domain-containing protein [Actinomyces sp. zg296]|uniref:Ig-like domain-containing protein n=1 Tax=Actinomyces sp. zg296 TaxID=2609289 RepID=UPI0013571562|nr:Ig-like domain-containing protein [Actinomyces sp. zg296]
MTSRASMVLIVVAMASLLFVLPVLPGALPRASAVNSCAGSLSEFAWQPGPNIVDVNGEKTYQSRGGQLARLQWKWTVDADANPGDTITMTLPDLVEVYPLLKPFDVYDGSGEKVGTVTWGPGKGATVTLTLGSYVSTHGSVSGSAFINIVWTQGAAVGKHDLLFKGCRGEATLKSELLPEPPAGTFAVSSKYGQVDSGRNQVVWSLGIGSATKQNYSDAQPVIEDPGGEGYVLSCDKLTIDNITPRPYDKVVYNKNFLDKSRYTCEKFGERGIRVTINKNADGNYIDRYESYFMKIYGTLDPNYKDYAKLHNTAKVKNGPDVVKGPDYDVPGEAEVPDAGGEGSGKQVKFSIQKEVSGPAPDGTKYSFEYKCLGDQFAPLPAVSAGEKTTSATTKSSARCTIREKDVPKGVTVAYEIQNPDSGATLTPGPNGEVTLTFKLDSEADVKIKATNTFPAELPAFSVKKETSDGSFVVGSTASTLRRTYSVTVTNTGTGRGTSPEVVDIPSTPQGFSIDKVEVDGVKVEKNQAGYYVTRGDELDVKASKTHEVVITYSLDPTAMDSGSFELLGQCQTGGAAADSTKGLYNKVTMEQDSDGDANNDACTVGEDRRGRVTWTKIDADTRQALAGSEWEMSGEGIPAGTVITDCVADNADSCAPQGGNGATALYDRDPKPGAFDVQNLPLANTWRKLRESKAPAGYVLNKRAQNFITHEGAPHHNFSKPFENSKSPVPMLPLTGGMGSDVFLISGGVVFLLGVAWEAARRVRSKRRPASL